MNEEDLTSVIAWLIKQMLDLNYLLQENFSSGSKYGSQIMKKRKQFPITFSIYERTIVSISRTTLSGCPSVN